MVKETFLRSAEADEILHNTSRTCGGQRRFSIILYPDSESYDWLDDSKDYRYPKLDEWIKAHADKLQHWAYVTHFNDKDVTGEKKKPHVHLGLCFSQNVKKTILTLADDFGLTSANQIICPKSPHWNWGKWEQQIEYYNHDECIGKVSAFETYYADCEYVPKEKRRVITVQQLRDEDENSKLQILFEILDDVNAYSTLRQFIETVAVAGVFSVYRRSQSTWMQLFQEKKQQCRDEKRKQEAIKKFDAQCVQKSAQSSEHQDKQLSVFESFESVDVPF